MVLQKNQLFSGTLRVNMQWGNRDATDEEIIKAAQRANIHDYIMTLPEGYETNIGERGVKLAGGQKQRLCIARALLKKPKILILDDSASALDYATEAGLRKNIASLPYNPTVFIVSQRASSVMHADKIIVLDDGRAEIGTHSELLKNNAVYREIHLIRKILLVFPDNPSQARIYKTVFMAGCGD